MNVFEMDTDRIHVSQQKKSDPCISTNILNESVGATCICIFFNRRMDKVPAHNSQLKMCIYIYISSKHTLTKGSTMRTCSSNCLSHTQCTQTHTHITYSVAKGKYYYVCAQNIYTHSGRECRREKTRV